MVLTLAAWLCTAGVTRSQAQAKRWHRYSCVGLEVDLPDGWQAEDNDPWSFYKKPDGPSILFSRWIALGAGQYRRGSERWLEGFPGPLPRTAKSLNVSGFEAVSLPADTPGRGTPLRDTWIGVPDNKTGFNRVYFFNLMAAGAEAEEGQMVYQKMLASMPRYFTNGSVPIQAIAPVEQSSAALTT